jgi:threonine dehydratase
MYESLRAGKRVTLDRVGTFADGVAVRRVGEETFRLARQYVDEILLVTTDQICAAIQDIFEDTRSIAEPSGALAVAGIKKYVAREACTQRRFIAINGGANMNFDRLRYIAERADIGAQREALLAVEIPEGPGSFLRFCEIVGRRSVTEFNYRYASAQTAQIFVGLALTQGKAERDALIKSIAAGGFSVRDMTDNEMAKLHVRYMVGGHGADSSTSGCTASSFPSGPGAAEIPAAIGTDWNISLFHYRNHGSDYGRVLAGIQVPPETRTDFCCTSTNCSTLHEETDNPAYKIFLGLEWRAWNR